MKVRESWQILAAVQRKTREHLSVNLDSMNALMVVVLHVQPTGYAVDGQKALALEDINVVAFVSTTCDRTNGTGIAEWLDEPTQVRFLLSLLGQELNIRIECWLGL